MLKAVKQLIEFNGNVLRLGNHSKRLAKTKKEVTEYVYFETAICRVHHRLKLFMIDNGGYDTPSTKRAISDYRYYFTQKGYKELDKKSFNSETVPVR